MTPTLLILAAGLGSRYGGMKQLDGMGPGGEIILDYSVYDARQAGFDRVVFVIRRDFEDEFRTRCGRRFEKGMAVDYAFQELADLPKGFGALPGRQKPWGTAHAILAARNVVSVPFAAINADDFYGPQAFKLLADFLIKPPVHAATFALVAYRLRNTLSEHGAVSRGVCEAGSQGRLQAVAEYEGIKKLPGGEICSSDGRRFDGDTPVSMNFWGLTPAVFPLLEAQFSEFLTARGNEPQAEFYIPTAIAEMIRRGEAVVDLLKTEAPWFGVTYREDRPQVMSALAALHASGAYPAPLWPA